MKVTKTIDTPVEFQPFTLTIEVATVDELISLHEAAGRMCNGHGLELYDLLSTEMRKYK